MDKISFIPPKTLEECKARVSANIEASQAILRKDIPRDEMWAELHENNQEAPPDGL